MIDKDKVIKLMASKEWEDNVIGLALLGEYTFQEIKEMFPEFYDEEDYFPGIKFPNETAYYDNLERYQYFEKNPDLLMLRASKVVIIRSKAIRWNASFQLINI